MAQPRGDRQQLADVLRRGGVDQQEVEQNAARPEYLELRQELRVELHGDRPARTAQRERRLIDHHHHDARLAVPWEAVAVRG